MSLFFSQIALYYRVLFRLLRPIIALFLGNGWYFLAFFPLENGRYWGVTIFCSDNKCLRNGWYFFGSFPFGTGDINAWFEKKTASRGMGVIWCKRGERMIWYIVYWIILRNHSLTPSPPPTPEVVFLKNHKSAR